MSDDKLINLIHKLIPGFLISIVILVIASALYIIDICQEIFGWEPSEMTWINYFLWFAMGFFVLMLLLITSPLWLAYLENWIAKIESKGNAIRNRGITNDRQQ